MKATRGACFYLARISIGALACAILATLAAMILEMGFEMLLAQVGIVIAGVVSGMAGAIPRSAHRRLAIAGLVGCIAVTIFHLCCILLLIGKIGTLW